MSCSVRWKRYILHPMATKVGFYTKLDPALRAAMRRFKEHTGVPEAQQVHRALTEWLGERADAGPLPKTTQKAVTKRTVRKTARRKS
jgi:hypothetical protein